MIILHLASNQLVTTYPGSNLDEALAQIEGSYVILQPEGLPEAPRSAWIVDWESGQVTVAPNYAPPPPPPNYGAAWFELINAPLYSRILGLAQSNIPISTEMGLLGDAFQSHRDLPPATWASALSSCCQRLAALVNATAAPLTAEEQQWVDAWSSNHHLGLTIDWEAA